MRSSTLNFRPCYRQIDAATASNFLFAHKDELGLPDKIAVLQVIDRLLSKGGILGAFDEQQQMQAMLGFFFGEPSQNFRNKEVLFIYVTALAPAYRLTRAFRDGLLYSLEQFQQMGVEEIRMQAGIRDRYTNKLYGRFAKPLGKGKTLLGQPVMTYGNTIAGALANLTGRQPLVGQVNSRAFGASVTQPAAAVLS